MNRMSENDDMKQAFEKVWGSLEHNMTEEEKSNGDIPLSTTSKKGSEFSHTNFIKVISTNCAER